MSEKKKKSEVPPAQQWRLKPIKTKVLIALPGEYRLVDGKEIDSEELNYKDPISRTKQRAYMGVLASVGSGFPRGLLGTGRFRLHYIRWGYPFTVSPYDGGVAVDPTIMKEKLESWGWKFDEEGNVIDETGKPRVSVFEDKDGQLTTRKWKIYDVSDIQYIMADETKKVQQQNYLALGKGLKSAFMDQKNLMALIAMILSFAFAFFMVYSYSGGF